MRLIFPILLALFLASCGRQESAGSAPPIAASELSAGEWEMSASLGGTGPSIGNPDPPMITKRCFNPAHSGALSARAALLELAPIDRCQTDMLIIKDYYLSGTMACKGVDDIPDHIQTVAGSYGKDWFQMTIDIPVFGTVARQTIDAKRIGDCS